MYWWVNLGIVCILIQYADGGCMRDQNNFYHFGPECKYLCHCKNGEACDEATGECTSGCENGWMGPACQYRDIAYRATSRHLDNLPSPQTANLANDGNLTTCSSTNDQSGERTTGPWWRVHFRKLEAVRGMVLTPNISRLGDFHQGFKITVENITNPGDQSPPPVDVVRVCYTHPTGVTVNSSFEIYCTEKLLGYQVRIQLDNLDAQLTLCDINIAGGRNVAVLKVASAKSTQSSPALAIDGYTATGDISKCSATAWQYNPWWQVDLGGLYMVDSVKLLYKGDGDVRHYKLFNWKSADNTWKLLHDDKGKKNPTTHIDIFEAVQILRIHRLLDWRIALKICELQAFGDCPDNRCGLDCSTVCYCKSFSYQQTLTGICTSGCAGRWTGSEQNCDAECADNTWGTSCQYHCGNCEDDIPCDVISGNCTGSCKPGYVYPSCATECDYGLYGNGCLENCSKNCRGGYDNCDKIDGYCTENCTAGWTGEKCDTACDPGFFGNSCLENCSENCLGGFDNCDNIDGHCRNNCTPGWKGEQCDTECDFGYYGEACNNTCSTHCNFKDNSTTRCDHVNGSCADGCVPGWTGFVCETVCDPGFFGDSCLNNCSENCLGGFDNCDNIDGHCTKNCTHGWKGEQCDAECEIDYFGEACNNTCNVHCRVIDNSTTWCDHVNGSCLGGCVPGWTGDACETECTDGFYGENCSKPCSHNCLGGFIDCHHENGICIRYCKRGWTGTLCDAECPDGRHGFNCSEECGMCASDSTCDKLNGTCHSGCSPDYEGERCITRKAANVSGPSMPVAGVAGGVAAAIIVIGVFLLVFFLLRRRRRNSKSQPGMTNLDGQDKAVTKPNGDTHIDMGKANGQSFAANNPAYDAVINNELQIEANEKKANDDTYYNEPDNLYYNSPGDAPIPKSGIYLTDLKDYVTTHCTSGRLEDEFKSVPYGLHFPTKEALKPANKGKSRYKDMHPYDHSRVILNTLPGQSDTDYINASFVDGYRKEKAFIAAQGPTGHNVADFWRMIWEKNVHTIVMVTNPTEKGKMKCIPYWTQETDTAPNDAFEVKVTSEETFHVMIVRKIQFKLTSESVSRTVTQYHFTAWPDKSTPDDATCLVQFLLKCRQSYENKNEGQVVVHCSAGVGRTGTFIGLDILYQQGKDLGYVDVLGVVKRLREQRVNMVQTKGQYIFLHEAVHEAVVLPSPVPLFEFLDVYPKLLETSQLQEQYLIIGEVLLSQKVRNEMNDINEDEDEFSVANYPDNKSRNRYNDILVANEFKPYLETQVEGCNNYINAVFVQSHRDSRGFLLSQAPLSHTAVDCCRLIVERSISCVVMFDYEKLEEEEKYLPEEESITIGPFEVKLVSSEQKNGYKMNTHEIVYKNKTQDVRQFVFNDWCDPAKAPTSDGLVSFLKLLEDVEAIQLTIEGPILVHCQNGADKSGLFAVMLHVMERMRMDDDVAIPQTIRLARRRRPQIIPNYEQYKFCHDAVRYHLEDSSTYANL